MARARRRGRPHRIPDTTIALMKGELARGDRQADIARRHGVSKSTVSRLNSRRYADIPPIEGGSP